jgi:hypothetical protein
MHMDFDTFASRYPASFVIEARLAGDFKGAELGAIGRHFRRLITSLATGDFATGVVRRAEELEFHCRFEVREDATAFGMCFGARIIGDGTRRWFVFDRSLYNGLQQIGLLVGPSRPRGRSKKQSPAG